MLLKIDLSSEVSDFELNFFCSGGSFRAVFAKLDSRWREEPFSIKKIEEKPMFLFFFRSLSKNRSTIRLKISRHGFQICIRRLHQNLSRKLNCFEKKNLFSTFLTDFDRKFFGRLEKTLKACFSKGQFIHPQKFREQVFLIANFFQEFSDFELKLFFFWQNFSSNVFETAFYMTRGIFWQKNWNKPFFRFFPVFERKQVNFSAETFLTGFCTCILRLHQKKTLWGNGIVMKKTTFFHNLTGKFSDLWRKLLRHGSPKGILHIQRKVQRAYVFDNHFFKSSRVLNWNSFCSGGNFSAVFSKFQSTCPEEHFLIQK